jgi:elongation factor Ts
MMYCKKALQETGGDEEKAIDLLRQKGTAKAAKRSGKETSEGTVFITANDGRAAMVELLSETDFVARSDDFKGFARRAAAAIADLDLPDGEILSGDDLFQVTGAEDVQSGLAELRLKVGENVKLSRVVAVDIAESGQLGSYLHFGSRIGVLVELGGKGAGEAGETARGIAMHVAASNPVSVDKDDIPTEVVERERQILIEQAKDEGKPAEIAEKMVEGRMRKFYEQSALLWQPYVRDPDLKVKDLLSAHGSDVTVRRFIRFEVGG